MTISSPCGTATAQAFASIALLLGRTDALLSIISRLHPRIEFSLEVVEEINHQRYNHLVPLVQRRMDAMRF